MKIEHHIEQKIVDSLRTSSQRLLYGQLKPDDLVNSHFSYYLNRLLTSKIIDKNDDGYGLTVEGARWLNDRSPELSIPRINIGLVICTGSEYLVAQRKGQMKTTINDYMIVTTPYLNENLNSQVESAIAQSIPEGSDVDVSHVGFVQYEVSYTDKVIHRLIYLVQCKTPKFPVPPNDHLEFTWMSLEDIKAIEHPSIAILVQAINLASGDTGKLEPTIIKNI